jgi:hypothetical protein
MITCQVILVNKDPFFPSREEYKNLSSGIIPLTIFATIHEEPFPIPHDCGICQDGTNALGGCAKKIRVLERYKWATLTLVTASHVIVGNYGTPIVERLS